MTTRYRVSWVGGATVRSASGRFLSSTGAAPISLPYGALLPMDVTPESIKHLLSVNMIEPVDGDQGADELPPAA